MDNQEQEFHEVKEEQSDVQETITDKQVQRKKRTPRKGGVDMVLTAKKDKKGLLWIQVSVHPPYFQPIPSKMIATGVN